MTIFTKIHKFVLGHSGWRYNKGMIFAMKSNIREREIEDKQIIKEKVVATWNKAYDIREKIGHDGAVEYARS